MLGSETVWVTLRECAPPMIPAALRAAKTRKPRKRNFDTVGRTSLFARALKSGSWVEAAMMLSATARLDFGGIKVSGAKEGDDHGKGCTDFLAPWHTTPCKMEERSLPCTS